MGSRWSSRNNGGFYLSYRLLTEAIADMAQLGKRYRCEVCGTEVLCTKAGEGKPVCCDKEMEIQEPRPLPSSD